MAVDVEKIDKNFIAGSFEGENKQGTTGNISTGCPPGIPGNINTGCPAGTFGIAGILGKYQYEIDFENTYPILSSEFKKIQYRQYQIFAQKMLDYGIDNIALGADMNIEENINISHQGVIIRCLDKINRLKNLIFKKQQNYVKNESILDTWKDLSIYSIIAQIILDKKWKR
jgi:hypothetical protein